MKSSQILKRPSNPSRRSGAAPKLSCCRPIGGSAISSLWLNKKPGDEKRQPRARGGNIKGHGRTERRPSVTAVETPHCPADAEAETSIDRLSTMLMFPGEEPMHQLHRRRMETSERGRVQSLRQHQHRETLRVVTDQEPAHCSEKK